MLRVAKSWDGPGDEASIIIILLLISWLKTVQMKMPVPCVHVYTQHKHIRLLVVSLHVAFSSLSARWWFSVKASWGLPAEPLRETGLTSLLNHPSLLLTYNKTIPLQYISWFNIYIPIFLHYMYIIILCFGKNLLPSLPRVHLTVMSTPSLSNRMIVKSTGLFLVCSVVSLLLSFHVSR